MDAQSESSSAGDHERNVRTHSGKKILDGKSNARMRKSLRRRIPLDAKPSSALALRLEVKRNFERRVLTDAAAACHLRTRHGHDVVVFKREGKWWAEIHDVSMESVPVVCLVGDVEAELRSLSRASSSLVWSRLHIERWGGRRWLVLGYLGLRGGGGRQSRVNQLEETEHGQWDAHDSDPSNSDLSSSPMNEQTIEEFIRHHDIKSTEELIESMNVCDESGRESLVCDMIPAYVDHLGNEKGTACHFKHLEEYVSLGKVHVTTAEARDVMRNSWLGELIRRAGQKHGEEWIIKAIHCAVSVLDVEIFKGHSSELVTLADILLKKLNPEEAHFTETAPWQCTAVCALRCIFKFISEVDPIKWDATDNQSPFRRFKKEIDEIIKVSSSRCFPVNHYAQLLRVSIMELSQSMETNLKRDCMTVWNFCKSSAQIWNGVVGILTFRIDLDAIEKGSTSIAKLTAAVGGPKKSWIIYLQELNSLVLRVLEDQTTNPQTFEKYLEKLRTMLNKESKMKLPPRKHLRYGMVEQLTMLALKGPTPKIQEECKRMLDALMVRDDLSRKDKDIQCLFSNSVNDDLTRLSIGSSTSQRIHISSSVKTLFQEIWIEKTTTERGVQNIDSEPCPRKAVLDDLRMGYEKHLGHMTSLIDRQKKDVRTMKFHLMKLRKREGQLNSDDQDIIVHSTDCGLESNDITHNKLVTLFSVDEDVSKVLVKGRPGAGKSSLAQRLMLDWSEGRWGQQYDAVFSVSVASLLTQDSNLVNICKESLVVAIANSCSNLIDRDISAQELKQFVRNELNNPKALVILDGVEEAKGEARHKVVELVNQSRTGKHKLLMFARPSIESIEADLIFKICALPTEDVLDCLSDNPTFRSQLQAHPDVLEVARNPMCLQILNVIVQSLDENIYDHLRRPAGLYSRFVVKLWQLYDEKSEHEAVSRDEAFKELGRLAMRGLMLEKWRIPAADIEVDVKHIVRKFSPDSRSLLLCYDNGDVEFTHIILQQYFAGRYLAEMLLKGERKEMKAKDIIEEVKHGEIYGEVLAVAAAELGQVKSVEGIEKLLAATTTTELDFLGLHRIRARLMCLQQWLLEGSLPKDQFCRIDEKFRISDTLKDLLKKGVRLACRNNSSADNVLLRGVVPLLRDFPDALAHSKTKLLKVVLSEMRKDWKVDRIVVEALAWIINVEVKDNSQWIQAVRKGLGDRDETVCESVIRHMRVMGEVSKASVPQLLDLLKKVPNERRNHAYNCTVIKVLRRDPQCVDNDLQSLVDVCRSTDYWIQLEAIKALPNILAGHPSRTENLLSILLQASSDPRQLSVSEIGVLGVCIKASPSQSDHVVNCLLNAWKTMGEDQLNETAQTLVQAIRVVADKAVAIVENLLKEQNGSLWSVAVQMLKKILKALRETADHADAVLEVIDANCMPKAEDSSRLELILEGIKNAVHVSARSLPKYMSVIVNTCDHDAWSIRSLVFSIVGTVARYQPEQLSDALIEIVIEGCKKEKVWKAKCAALQAAAELVASRYNHPGLVDTGLHNLKDPDDVIRKLAGKVVAKAISLNVKIRYDLMNELLDDHKTSTDEIKHGIVHCFNLVIKECPEMISNFRSTLIESAHSQNALLAATAVSGLLHVVSADQGNTGDLIAPLKAACNRQRTICYCALEALATAACKDQRHMEYTAAYLKNHPEPLNDHEWMIYLQALGIAVEDSPKDKKYIKMLFTEPEKESRQVQDKRREIIHQLSSHTLIECYNQTKLDLIVHSIVERLCEGQIEYETRDKTSSKTKPFYKFSFSREKKPFENNQGLRNKIQNLYRCRIG